MGPTTSICIWSHGVSGVAKVPRGVATWQCTIARWHRQAHFLTSMLMNGHTYLLVTRRCVAQMPGWEIESSETKIIWRKQCSTYGRRMPVNISQVIEIPSESKVILCRLGSLTWARASSWKFTTEVFSVWRAFTSRRESTSVALCW